MATAAAKLSDIEVAYDTFGDGPPLVAIMGLTGARYHWRGFPERFADQFKVITFDNRGVGKTTAPPGPYSAQQMARDALALMDHLAIEKAAILGVSMGGMIAQELALAAPERVTKLVLGCTSFGGLTAIPVPPATSLAFANVGRGVDALRHVIELNFSAAWVKENAAKVTELLEYGLANRMTPAGFQGQLMAVATHDTAARIAKITAETLVITGDEDHLIPAENARLIAARIPGARTAILPGVGHMFWIEGADAAEAEIRGFLQR